ncbi:MAG: molybdopterin molybdotransferase MoeA [Candidatus Muiribacteriota bacterium]
MISIKKVHQIINSNLTVMDETIKNINRACGYVLSENIYSKLAHPQADNSSMDGYTFKYSDYSIKEGIKLSKKKIQAGSPLKKLKKGYASKIFTGALIPEGADTVVEKEITQIKNNTLFVKENIKKGRNLRYKGEDIPSDTLLLKKGTLISAFNLPLIISSGNTNVKVFKKPVVTLISTGNELVKAGSRKKIQPHQIYDSNTVMLTTMLKQTGVEKIYNKKIFDNFDKTKKTLKESIEKSDIVITIGGISMGDYDFVGDALNKLKCSEHFRKVNVRPGKPFSYFKFKSKSIFCLPGNPVSSNVSFNEFVSPAIKKIYGLNYNHVFQKAIYKGSDYLRKGIRDELLRGVYTIKNGTYQVELAGSIQNSNILSELAESNCFIYFCGEKKKLKKHDEVLIRAFR